VIEVPAGTVIKDAQSGELLGELLEDGERCIAARGGRGGFGNEHFKSPRNRAPRKTTPGREGEARTLEITLKLVADVGLVGEPNAGKSTLLSVVSAARPQIADYPFTTKTPVLGIVKAGDFKSFVMIDIPGLIEGAHQGRGMGKDHLRHVERCRVILYLVDVTSPDPAAVYASLRNELLHYDPSLLEKPSLLALSKCDLLPGGAKAVDRDLLKIHSRVEPISSVSGEGIATLIRTLQQMLQ